LPPVENWKLELYNLIMNFKIIVAALIIVALVFGATKLIRHYKEKQEASSSYLQETVGAVQKVKQMKLERSETLRHQEKTLLEEE